MTTNNSLSIKLLLVNAVWYIIFVPCTSFTYRYNENICLLCRLPSRNNQSL